MADAVSEPDSGRSARGAHLNQGARITPRNRRLDEALQTPKRGIWIATGIIVVLGILVLVWAVSPTERRRRSVMGDLELNDPASRVTELMGAPGARCPGSSVAHLARSFPPGWPASATEAALQEMGEETRERWVYPISLRRTASCAPRDGQTEIGVGRDGRVLWYVVVVGKTPLQLPDTYSPAAPEGAPGS